MKQIGPQIGDDNKIKVAFVDVSDEGELLKETFDIESTPSLVFVKEGLVYYLEGSSWNLTDVVEFVKTKKNK